jgi:hypothetical protein
MDPKQETHIVEPCFSQEELEQILNLSREDGPYSQYRNLIAEEGVRGSGLAKELWVEEQIDIPRYRHLENKDNSIETLNYFLTLVNLINQAPNSFLKDTFFLRDTKDVRKLFQNLSKEVSSVIDKFGWKIENQEEKQLLNYVSEMIEYSKRTR